MNIPEDFLYQRIPPGVVSEDTRKLLRSVVGGFQDRIVELRALADQIRDLWVPDNSVGEATRVVIVTYTDSESGETRQSTLSTDAATPYDQQNLYAWCASQSRIDQDQIIDVQQTTDQARTAENRTLLLLADTLGAKLYDTIAASDDTRILNQKRALKTYFARLKVKGTSSSFEFLGRLHGFDDVRFVPLWGRVSPRLPNSVAASDNDQDFSPYPQGLPTPGQPSDLYNPDNLNDGDIFIWASAPLGVDQSQTDYILDGINGFNPYVKVVSVGQVSLPAAGTYFMQGGTFGKPAETTELLTAAGGKSGLKFVAIADGQSFNSAQLVVQPAANGKIQVVIYHNLSSIKFRTSYFNLTATTNYDSYANLASTRITTSSDLAKNPAVYKDVADGVGFTNGGTAIDPYRYWSGGSKPQPVINTWPDYSYSIGSGASVPRTQASADTLVLDVSQLVQGGQRLLSNLDDVRPATRYLRQFGSGLSFETNVQYAPHVGESDLFTVSSTDFRPNLDFTGAAGTVGTDYPANGFSGTFTVDIRVVLYTRQNTASSWSMSSDTTVTRDITAESHPTATTWTYLNYVHEDPRIFKLSGWFDFTPLTANYSITVPNFGYEQDLEKAVVTATVRGHWIAVTTETLQIEPVTDSRNYQTCPEDELELTYQLSLEDSYPWRRAMLAGGEEITENEVSDIDVTQTLSTVQVEDESGNLYSVTGVDFTTSDRGYAVLRQDTGSFGQRAVGFKPVGPVSPQPNELLHSGPLSVPLTNELGLPYTVGSVRGILAADPSAHWTPAHSTGLVMWLHCGEHPLQAYVIADYSNYSLTQTDIEHGGFSANYLLRDRTWDTNRGWTLKLRGQTGSSPAGFFTINKSRLQGLNFTLAFWINASQHIPSMDEQQIVAYGPFSATLHADVQSPTYTGYYVKFYMSSPDGTAQLLGQQPIFPGEFDFCSVSVAELNLQSTLVDVCATTNVDVLVGLPIIDGIDLRPGMTVILVGQDLNSENGVYLVSSAMWVRLAKVTGQDERGAYYKVTSGDNAGLYVCQNDNVLEYGVSGIRYARVNVQWSGSIGSGQGYLTPFSKSDANFTVNAPKIDKSPDLQISDIRMWDVAKTADELTTIQYPAVKPLAVSCRPTFFTSTSGALKAFEVTQSGYAFPSVRPIDYYAERLVRATRYAGSGEYSGPDYRLQVGLGDAKAPSSAVTLGLVGPELASQGTGIAASNAAAPLASSNPGLEQVYVLGDDNTPYKVSVKVDLGVPSLVATKASQDLQTTNGDIYQPDFVQDITTALDKSGVGRLAVILANGKPSVTRRASLGKNTPSLYLYSKYEGYIDYQFPASGQTWVNSALPSATGLPTRKDAGKIEFIGAPVTLQPGKYRVTIDASALGQTDKDFTGFNTEVNLSALPSDTPTSSSSAVIQTTLVPSGNGTFQVVYGLSKSSVYAANCDTATFQLALDSLRSDTMGGVTVLDDGSQIGGPYHVKFNGTGAKSLLEFNTGNGLQVEVIRLVSGTDLIQEEQIVIFNRQKTALDFELTRPILSDESNSWNLQVYLSSTNKIELAIHGISMEMLATRLYKIDPSTTSLQLVEQINLVSPTQAGGFQMQVGADGQLGYAHEKTLATTQNEIPAAHLLTGSTESRSESLVPAQDYQPVNAPTPPPPGPMSLTLYVDSVFPGADLGLSAPGSTLGLYGVADPNEPPLAPVQVGKFPFMRDSFESYNGVIRLNGLNGGVDFYDPYAARPTAYGIVDIDNMETYTNGSDLTGLDNGSFGAGFACRRAFNGFYGSDSMETYGEGDMNGLNGGVGWSSPYVSR